jgi:poly(3-hydroxybutyrate) depolymerase
MRERHWPACRISGTLAAVVLFLSPAASARSSSEQTAATDCVSDRSAGDHVFSCSGLRVDMRVPRACLTSACGVILDLHGDTGTGLLEDAHTKLRDLGDRHGYIVIAPTGLGSTWSAANDATLVDIVRRTAAAFHADPARIHVTGFSRGGFTTWRLVCSYSDLFASAAPGGASDGRDRGDNGCFTDGRRPSRKIPLLLLIGREDRAVGYPGMINIRDAAIAAYGATNVTVLRRDATFTDTQWTAPDGATIEVLEHSYTIPARGAWAWAGGHCYPGSTVDPQARQYALACQGPNAFVWGEEVMRFFMAHPTKGEK